MPVAFRKALLWFNKPSLIAFPLPHRAPTTQVLPATGFSPESQSKILVLICSHPLREACVGRGCKERALHTLSVSKGGLLGMHSSALRAPWPHLGAWISMVTPH